MCPQVANRIDEAWIGVAEDKLAVVNLLPNSAQKRMYEQMHHFNKTFTNRVFLALVPDVLGIDLSYGVSLIADLTPTLEQ